MSVCVCLHVSLLVSPCVPTASLVRNSWFPPSATPLHQQPQNVYMLYVCFPCVAGSFFSQYNPQLDLHKKNVISTDLRGHNVH